MILEKTSIENILTFVKECLLGKSGYVVYTLYDSEGNKCHVGKNKISEISEIKKFYFNFNCAIDSIHEDGRSATLRRNELIKEYGKSTSIKPSPAPVREVTPLPTSKRCKEAAIRSWMKRKNQI